VIEISGSGMATIESLRYMGRVADDVKVFDWLGDIPWLTSV